MLGTNSNLNVKINAQRKIRNKQWNNPYLAYEAFKKQLRMLNLAPKEYEKAILQYCRKVGI